MKCEQKKKRKSRLKNRSSRRKKTRNYDASNSAGAVDFNFQADQSTPQCRWEMETTSQASSRPLCAVLGSGDMFRVKNFEGIPYTQCPLNDGAIPIIELPYLLVMGSISNQKLTKVRKLSKVGMFRCLLVAWHTTLNALLEFGESSKNVWLWSRNWVTLFINFLFNVWTGLWVVTWKETNRAFSPAGRKVNDQISADCTIVQSERESVRSVLCLIIIDKDKMVAILIKYSLVVNAFWLDSICSKWPNFYVC